MSLITPELKSKFDVLLGYYPADQRQAAVIPLLHLMQDSVSGNYLTSEAQQAVADYIGIPVVKVHEVVSFYTMLSEKKRGKNHMLVCHTLPCDLTGCAGVVDAIHSKLHISDGGVTADGKFSMEEAECLARCGEGPVMQVGDTVYTNLTPEKTAQIIDELAKEGLMETPLYLTRNFKNPAAATYDGYVAGGGYTALKKALAMQPQEIIEEVKKGNLRGRGGAGFPAGVKWGFLPKDHKGPKYLCVNADEGEPGTFKDGPLMEFDPHQMLEGIAITCYATDIHTAYVYIRGEFHKAYAAVEKAIEECYAKGIFGKSVMGSGFALECRPHPGAGAYICGEETGLISSLEGKKGFPKLKPPFPAIKGLFGCPTLVNNVETLACVPHIINIGADAWAALGCEKNGGTKLYCVSGQIAKPGLYETRHSITLRELLYDVCGGPLPGRTIKAVIPGGSSAKILKADEIDVRMDFDSLGKAGTMLGSAAVIVIDDSTSMVRALDNLLRFYAHESCGQCTPCREGTRWISKTMRQIANGQGQIGDLDKILDILTNMVGNTICVLADAAAFPAESFIKKFRPEFEEYIRKGKRMSMTGWREEKAPALAGAH